MERILNKRKVRGKDKYLVRWKGFIAESDTWEGRENLENTKEAIEEFEKLDRLRTTILESILSGQYRSGRHQHFGGVFVLSRKPDSRQLLRQFPDLSLGHQIHKLLDLGGQILLWTQIERPKSDRHHALRTTCRH